MRPIIAAISTVFLSCQFSSARSDQTAEGFFTSQVAMAVHEFAEEHAGTCPSSWADLQPYFSNKPIDELFPQILPSKRYLFYSKPLRLTYRFEGEVILITRKPFRDITYGSYGRRASLTEPSRYLVYRDNDGNILRTRVTENRIQDIFQGSGFPLPEPDSEPERMHEQRFQRNKIAGWALAATALGVISSIFYMYSRRRISLFGTD